VSNGVLYVYDHSGPYAEACIVALPFEAEETKEKEKEKKQATASACLGEEFRTKSKLCDHCISKRKRGDPTPLWMLPITARIHQLQIDVRSLTLYALNYSHHCITTIV
jgi:hypothetical protein